MVVYFLYACVAIRDVCFCPCVVLVEYLIKVRGKKNIRAFAVKANTMPHYI